MIEIVHGASRAAVVDPAPQDFGEKAAALLRLAHHGRRSRHFKVVNFALIPAGELEAFRAAQGPPPIARFPGVPFPDAISSEVEAYYRHFADRFDRVTSRRFDATQRTWYLRTSLVVDHPLELPGVNFGAMLAPGISDLRRALGRVLAALHRPYAQWYLGMSGLEHVSPSAGLMLCEAVAIRISGRARVRGDSVEVYYERRSPGGRRFPAGDVLMLDLRGDLSSLPAGWSPGNRAERLRSGIADLLTYDDCGGRLEVEFFFDESDTLYFNQYRAYRIVDGGLTDILSHAPVLLLNQPRSIGALRQVLPSSMPDDRVLVTHLESRTFLDAFAVAWRSHNDDAPRRFASTLILHEGNVAISHLPDALRDCATFGTVFEASMQSALRDAPELFRAARGGRPI